MSQPDEAIPLPPIGPPPVLPAPHPFQAPEGVQWPPDVPFRAEVPRDDLELLADGVVQMVLGQGVPFDQAVAFEFIGGLENEVWGSTSGSDAEWATALERAIDPASETIVDHKAFEPFRAALASALFRTDLLDSVLRLQAYVDAEGFVVTREEVRERLRAIVMGEVTPTPNDFVWSREGGSAREQ